MDPPNINSNLTPDLHQSADLTLLTHGEPMLSRSSFGGQDGIMDSLDELWRRAMIDTERAGYLNSI